MEIHLKNAFLGSKYLKIASSNKRKKKETKNMYEKAFSFIFLQNVNKITLRRTF